MAFKLICVVAAAAANLFYDGQAMAERHVLVPPVSPACISSPFGPRVLPDHPQAGTYHFGIDLPAPVGAPIVATAAGKVIRIHDGGPGGVEILVQHEGFIGVYSHLGIISPMLVEGRTYVAAGEKIGTVGESGIIFGTHVYFEMILAGKPVDPEPYLRVPLCSGATHRTVTAQRNSDAVDGITVDGRKYYMLLPQAR